MGQQPYLGGGLDSEIGWEGGDGSIRGNRKSGLQGPSARSVPVGSPYPPRFARSCGTVWMDSRHRQSKARMNNGQQTSGARPLAHL